MAKKVVLCHIMTLRIKTFVTYYQSILFGKWLYFEPIAERLRLMRVGVILSFSSSFVPWVRMWWVHARSALQWSADKWFVLVCSCLYRCILIENIKLRVSFNVLLCAFLGNVAAAYDCDLDCSWVGSWWELPPSPQAPGVTPRNSPSSCSYDWDIKTFFLFDSFSFFCLSRGVGFPTERHQLHTECWRLGRWKCTRCGRHRQHSLHGSCTSHFRSVIIAGCGGSAWCLCCTEGDFACEVDLHH